MNVVSSVLRGDRFEALNFGGSMGFQGPFLYRRNSILLRPHELMGLRLRIIFFLYSGLTDSGTGQTWTGE